MKRLLTIAALTIAALTALAGTALAYEEYHVAPTVELPWRQ